MPDNLTLEFRAQVIADTTRFVPHGTMHKRMVAVALRELREAVDQALRDAAESKKEKA